MAKVPAPPIKDRNRASKIWESWDRQVQKNTEVTANIIGTTSRITVTDNGDGSVTLSTPQNTNTGASPQFINMTLSALTIGSIPFAGAGGVITQDNANLFWNNTNKRLGIAKIPAYTLDVGGDLNIDAGKVFRVNTVQVIGARVIDARVGDVIEAAFTGLYPFASGILDACRDAIVSHGLVAAA